MQNVRLRTRNILYITYSVGRAMVGGVVGVSLGYSVGYIVGPKVGLLNIYLKYVCCVTCVLSVRKIYSILFTPCWIGTILYRYIRTM